MTTLLEKALQKVGALPEDEQNAIASEILDSLADEEAWKVRLTAKRTGCSSLRRKRFRRTSEARRVPWTMCF